MAIVVTDIPAGGDSGNRVDDAFILDLVWNSTVALSTDMHTMTYTRPETQVHFDSDEGFSALWTGTVNAIRASGMTVSGLQIDGQTMLMAIRDSDPDAINDLLWSGSDTMTGSAGIDEFHGFAGNDLLRGGGGDDGLFGGSGQDRLYGDAANDFLTGGGGRDRLYGGAGNDTLMGGAGDDRLFGGPGIDRMMGGTGADQFVFVSASDLVAVAPTDVIADFRVAEGDTIDLEGIDADTTLDGDQAFSFIGAAAFTENAPGTMRITPAPQAGVFVVSLNSDNDAQAEHLLVVVSNSTFDDSVFFL